MIEETAEDVKYFYTVYKEDGEEKLQGRSDSLEIQRKTSSFVAKHTNTRMVLIDAQTHRPLFVYHAGTGEEVDARKDPEEIARAEG